MTDTDLSRWLDDDLILHLMAAAEAMNSMVNPENEIFFEERRLLAAAALIESQWERISLIDSKFQSGNSVEVDRIVITREEWFGGEG